MAVARWPHGRRDNGNNDGRWPGLQWGEKGIFLCSGTGSNPWLTARCCQSVPGLEAPVTAGITQCSSFLGFQPPLDIYIQLPHIPVFVCLFVLIHQLDRGFLKTGSSPAPTQDKNKLSVVMQGERVLFWLSVRSRLLYPFLHGLQLIMAAYM